MNRLSLIAIACAASTTALGLLTSPAQAASLGELIESNGTFTDEHLTFSNFNMQVACLDFNNSNATCDDLFAAGHIRPTSAFQIGVGPATTPHGPGIRFNDFFRAEDGYGIDIALSYDVKSTKPIDKFHLSFDSVLDSGQVEIIETASDMNGNPIGQLFADNITEKQDPNNKVPDLATSGSFSKSVYEFQILKDINLTSEIGTGLSNMTTVDQEYSSVPEPLTILGSAAALGFGVAFKKEQSRKKSQK
ncbi:PEP-CTERM sorting domain-containing protein [Coleofasciculus sp.]|uniref:PEP-CTERM sorting domain-containing protein n=1 Tax=Coleofasciculus sp. TaxID=3100458 RepID=UPI003A39FBB5